MRLESDRASAIVSLSRGGRLASLVVDGHELLVTAGDDADFGWGSFPMAPYAGRVARGRFDFRGSSYELPISMAPHAIHGTAWRQTWSVTGDGEIRAELGPEWPLGGSVTQHFELSDESLDMTLTVSAGDQAMPAMVGWHPWFRRRLLQDRTISATLEFEAGAMYDVDRVMIPTGTTSVPSPGPWDNCFTDVSQPLRLSWPGAVSLELTSSCDHWVIYDRPEHAICVEPQSGPPDEFNRTPLVLEPGASLSEQFRISWGTT